MFAHTFFQQLIVHRIFGALCLIFLQLILLEFLRENAYSVKVLLHFTFLVFFQLGQTFQLVLGRDQVPPQVQRQHGQDEQLRFILGRKKKETNTQTNKMKTKKYNKSEEKNLYLQNTFSRCIFFHQNIFQKKWKSNIFI